MRKLGSPSFVHDSYLIHEHNTWWWGNLRFESYVKLNILYDVMKCVFTVHPKFWCVKCHVAMKIKSFCSQSLILIRIQNCWMALTITCHEYERLLSIQLEKKKNENDPEEENSTMKFTVKAQCTRHFWLYMPPCLDSIQTMCNTLLENNVIKTNSLLLTQNPLEFSQNLNYI